MKIAIIGPPGAGKTTLAAGLFFELKIMGKSVEMVPELIKYKLYQNKDFTKDGFDIYNNIEQREFEEIFDNATPKLDYIICEAPTCNSYFYASYYNKAEKDILKTIAKNTINNYDVIIKLPLQIKDDKDYETHGRKESFKESKKLNDHIFNELKKLGYKNHIIEITDRNSILNVIVALEKIKDNI